MKKINACYDYIFRKYKYSIPAHNFGLKSKKQNAHYDYKIFFYIFCKEIFFLSNTGTHKHKD